MNGFVKLVMGIFAAIFGLMLIIFIAIAGFNTIRVWTATSVGEAELAQAVQNRQITTLEAKAKLESARFDAQADVERAKGIAQSNDIIMNRLGGPRNYLAWKQIEALEGTKATLIYVPTEGGLPITEATRLSATNN